MSDQTGHQSQRMASKVALVTGAASGIGRAAALMLAKHGAKVICADIAVERVAATAAQAGEAGGMASAAQLDATSEASWQQALKELVRLHSRLDVLVNCAGISFAAPVTEMKLEDWRRVMAVNMEGVFLGTKHAIPVMRQASRGGSIVNVSSAAGIKAAGGASAYSASKAAVCMFTRAVAKECVDLGDPIRLNSVCPSGVKTPMWTAMPFFQELVAKMGSVEAAYQSMSQSLFSRRFAEPEEIAEAILYLASDESRFVTGTDLIIDGGYTL